MKKTPLNEIHRKSGGKLVDFNGWEMPIQYEGILAEHRRTREHVSIFDVSHMGEIYFEGKDALANVQQLTTNDASKLFVGQAQYSAMLYENGGFVDDITVYRLGSNKYMFCVNASNLAKDFAWIQQHIAGDCNCENASDNMGQIALQGRDAIAVLKNLTPYSLGKIGYYHFVQTNLDEEDVIVARMGYTGEDGFEIFCEKEVTEKLWKTIMSEGKTFGIAPAGLGARDTLRLEVNYPLYGNDIDDKHNPYEAGLGWIVKLDKGDFVGKQALLEIREKGVEQKLISFKLDVKGVPRSHYKIFDSEASSEIGEVTSGTSSPTLRVGIGMGYVASKYSQIGTKINIQIRDKFFPATIVKKPFVFVKK